MPTVADCVHRFLLGVLQRLTRLDDSENPIYEERGIRKILVRKDTERCPDQGSSGFTAESIASEWAIGERPGGDGVPSTAPLRRAPRPARASPDREFEPL